MPETSSAILEAKQRARDYWDIDGLPTLLAGAATFVWGVLYLPIARHRPWWSVALILGLWLSLFLVLISKKTLEWLKGRITYPRTGYVAPPEAAPERDPYTIISVIKEPVVPIMGRASRDAILNLPLLLFVSWFDDLGWILCLACMASALLFWWQYREDPPWFEIAGAAIAGVAILQVNGLRPFGIILLVLGATGMVKGATLLTRYLRQHPAPQA